MSTGPLKICRRCGMDLAMSHGNDSCRGCGEYIEELLHGFGKEIPTPEIPEHLKKLISDLRSEIKDLEKKLELAEDDRNYYIMMYEKVFVNETE